MNAADRAVICSTSEGAPHAGLRQRQVHAQPVSAARRIMCDAIGCAALILALAPGFALGFDFEEVAHRAQQLAAQPYRPQRIALPKELQGIDYDRFRDIRFRTARMLWRDAKLPFEVAFFHLGLYFDQPVRINELTGNSYREI